MKVSGRGLRVKGFAGSGFRDSGCEFRAGS